MKRRRTPIRRDRDPSEAPHARIPDALYSLLQYFSPYELKLWIALKCRERRLEGRGLVRKSLRRISSDIGMPWTTAQRAMNGLRLKGLAEWAGSGIRVLSPDFTRALTTGFTTEVTQKGQRIKGENGPTRTRGGSVRDHGWSYQDQGGHLVPFPANGLDGARSVFTDPTRARSAPSARVVDASTDSAQHAPSGKARTSARSSRALPAKTETAGKEEPEKEERERPVSRDEAKAAIERIYAAARDSDVTLASRRQKQRQREKERIEELRRQAAELEED